MKEAWIYGCGTCGRDLYLKADLSIESRPSDSEYLPDAAEEPCEHCRASIEQAGTEAVPLMITTASSAGISGRGDLITDCLNHLMGWCTCGNPEDMTVAIMQYLEITGSDERFDYQENDEARRILWYMFGYVSDWLEWTEHGGSVGACWLTETGKEALRKYKEATKDA